MYRVFILNVFCVPCNKLLNVVQNYYYILYVVTILKRTKIHFLNEQRSREAAAKKELYNTSGVGISNIIRKSIYHLTTSPTNHTYTF